MKNKDILELKKRFKKEQCTFTRVCGCYVNSEKETLLEFKETFLNLPDDELFKYLEIAKKALSGKIGNNLLELNFPLDANFQNEKQQLLMMLKRSGLKEDTLLSLLYKSIIDHYEYEGNFLILVYHDVYDVMVKTSDNRKLDESEEVYEYIICAICPVTLSKPGLGYFEEESEIKCRIRDWVVEMPAIAFTYPAFIDRESDTNTVMYYTKNAKNPQTQFMHNVLGCHPKQTATNQLESFEELVKSSVIGIEDDFEEVFITVQENLNTMVEEYHEIYEDTNPEPITLSTEKVKDLLIESGFSEEATIKIETSFKEQFGEDPPLAEHLIDTKLLKKNAQKKKEKQLISQIEELESKLEQMDQPVEIHEEVEIVNDSTSDDVDPLQTSNEQQTKDYDVVLHVKPDKLHTIKTELTNGQKCIIVPIDDDEQATINGIEDLI